MGMEQSNLGCPEGSFIAAFQSRPELIQSGASFSPFCLHDVLEIVSTYLHLPLSKCAMEYAKVPAPGIID